MRTIRKSGAKTQSELLFRAEEIIRSFFQEQFSESPRLLRLEFISGAIHVRGYRSLAPAEIKALGDTLASGTLQLYHDALVRSAKTRLKEQLQSGLHQSGLDVEWFLDAIRHEFDIIINFRDDGLISRNTETRKENK